MTRKKFFIRIASLVFLIFILNYLAQKFYWYYTIWYFDMIMHFLGGFWVGLASLWIFSGEKDFKAELNARLTLNVVAYVLFIGISWEFFEYFFVNNLAGNPFNMLDTVSDVFFDLAGGIFSVFYFFIRIMGNRENRLK